MAAIIDEAHKQGLKVYVHAPVLKYAKEVLRAGADGLAHGILSDPVDDEFISLMKKNDAVYVATNAVFNSVADLTGWSKRAQTADSNGIISQAIFDAGTSPELEKQWNSRWNNIAYTKERIPTLQANLRKVYAAGIPVVLGSDSSGAFVGLASQIELSLEAEAGLSAYQVIQTATINAARMINREKDLGSIEEGKLADMLILNADPLADIANIRKIYRIVKGGVVYEQSQLLPKQN
jgi:imidazolonepropionase-like amidohydrolase